MRKTCLERGCSKFKIRRKIQNILIRALLGINTIFCCESFIASLK